MASKTIAEMSDEEIEAKLSNTRLKIEKKESLIRELSARYADKIVGNTKPDSYFRSIENNKVDMSAARKVDLPNSTQAVNPELTRNIILVGGTILIIVVCLGACVFLLIALF